MTIQIGSADELSVSIEQVAEFYDTHWPRKIALAGPEFAHWQFCSAPGQEGGHVNCVALSDSKLLGIMGLNERNFTLRGDVLTAAELTTWIVQPDAKGKGLGPRMLDDLQSRYSVLLGSGISDEALNVYLRKGFNFWRYIPRFFRPFNVAPLESFAEIGPLGRKLARLREPSGSGKASATPVAAAEVQSFEMPESANGYLRNREHFAWRFDSHPVYGYEAFNIGADASVILRVDAIKGLNFAHVMEVLGPESSYGRVLSFLDDFGIERGLDVMDFTCTNSRLGGHLIAHGWFSSVDEPSFAFINLFYPPELRDPQTTSLIYWAKDRQAELADLGSLLVTKSDLDLDRPTGAFYEDKDLPLK